MSLETIVSELAHLRRDFDRHDAADLQKFKYAHNMLEDLLEKGARFDESMKLFRDERLGSSKAEMNARELLASMEPRLRTVERLAWLLVVGLIGILCNQILKLLA